METPVIYFYTDEEIRASVRVNFPKGWITEWYPFAAAPPRRNVRQPRAQGQSLRWEVKLLADQSVRLPREKGESHYYQGACDGCGTCASGSQRPGGRATRALRGGAVAQTEKFLFYRGVGMFAPPVAVRAFGRRPGAPYEYRRRPHRRSGDGRGPQRQGRIQNIGGSRRGGRKR